MKGRVIVFFLEVKLLRTFLDAVKSMKAYRSGRQQAERMNYQVGNDGDRLNVPATWIDASFDRMDKIGKYYILNFSHCSPAHRTMATGGGLYKCQMAFLQRSCFSLQPS